MWEADVECQGKIPSENAEVESADVCACGRLLGISSEAAVMAVNGSLVRGIGITHAKANTALTCLVYNIFRYERLCRC